MGIDKHTFGRMRSIDTQTTAAGSACFGRGGRNGRSYRLPIEDAVLGAGCCGCTHNAAHARGSAEGGGARREGEFAAANWLDVFHAADGITLRECVRALHVRVTGRVVLVPERRADAGATLSTVVHWDPFTRGGAVEDEIARSLEGGGGVATVGTRRRVAGMRSERVYGDGLADALRSEGFGIKRRGEPGQSV